MSAKLAGSGPRSDEGNGARSATASLDFVPLLCAGVAFLCIIFMGIALGENDWVEGTAMREGKPVKAYVGLNHVKIGKGENATIHSFSDEGLCPPGPHDPMPKAWDGIDTTPVAVWCAAKGAGTAAAWFLWLAFLTLWIAFALSVIEGLAEAVGFAKNAKVRLAAAGFANRKWHFMIIGTWAVSWMFIFLGMLAYAAAVPESLGWGPVGYETAFGLARLTFLLVTAATAVLASKLLELWHEELLVEALTDLYDARGVRLALYALLFAQLLLFLLVTIGALEWQALVPLFALYYLDTDKTNFLVVYVTLVLMTLLFDCIRILGLPRLSVMEGKEPFAESVYFLIFLSKFAVLALFGVLKRDELRQSRSAAAGAGDDPEIAE